MSALGTSEEVLHDVIEKLKEDLRSIGGLENVTSATHFAPNVDIHGILMHLEKVASAQDVQQHFCNNTDFSLRANVIGNAYTLLGHDIRPRDEQDPPVFISPCKGCNLPYETVDDPDGKRKYHRLEADKDEVLVRDIHLASIYLLLVSKLMGCSFLLSPEQRSQLAKHFLCQEGTPDPGTPVSLYRADSLLLSMEVLGRCSNNSFALIPACARSAAAFLSIMVSHRPATILAALDPDRLCCSLAQYFCAINARMTTMNPTHAPKDIIVCVSSLLQILPLLNHLVDWRETIAFFEKHELYNHLMVMLKNMSLFLTTDALRTSMRKADEPMDYSLMPDMVQCVNLVEELYGKDGLVNQRPTSVAIVGTLEVLTKWKRAGVPGVAAALARMGNQDLRTSAQCMAQLSRRAPALTYGLFLWTGLMEKNPQEPTDSIFRGGIVHCHLASCPTTEKLRRCSSCGVAFYCCAQHQQEHWYWHKGFCKKQKKLLSKKKGN